MYKERPLPPPQWASSTPRLSSQHTAIPREAYPDSMLRSTSRLDVLRANTVIFREHGLALKRVAKPATRVVVVANPANTNALIVAAHADTLPKSNFTSLSRLDQNRTAAQIAAKINSMYNPQVCTDDEW